MKRAVPFTMKPMSDLKPLFAPDDVEVLERDTPFQGFFRVDTLILRHRQYNGGWGKPVRRELFVRPQASAVLPLIRAGVKSCWWSNSVWARWSGARRPGAWS